MNLKKLTVMGSLALLSSIVFAQPQSYTPGFAINVGSAGTARLTYLFSNNNLEAVYLGAAYTAIAMSADKGEAPPFAELIPITIGYTRYFQLEPDKFDNKLFWSFGPYYTRYFLTTNDDEKPGIAWAAGLAAGLEYRLNSQVSIGFMTKVYNHAVFPIDEDTPLTFSTILANNALYFSYEF